MFNNHASLSSHRRFPSSGSAEAGGSNSLQSSPIRSLPHWNSQSSMPSTPDLRTRTPHYVHSTRSVFISLLVYWLFKASAGPMLLNLHFHKFYRSVPARPIYSTCFFFIILHLTGQWTSVPHVYTVSLSTLGTAAQALSLRANCWHQTPTHTRTPWAHWAALTSFWAQDAAPMALTHWTTAHPAPAKAAQSIITPLVDPPAPTPITLLWERTHPPKPGRGRGKGTGKSVHPFF